MLYAVKPAYRSPKNVSIDSLASGNVYQVKNGATRTYTIPGTMKPQSDAKRTVLDLEKRYFIFYEELVELMSEYTQRADEIKKWHTFYIPKKTGGQRRIDAPCDGLKRVQTRLLDLFNKYFPDMHHTSAFAYVSDRNTLSCLRKHVKNKSKFYMKTDFSDFFGSFSFHNILKQMQKVSPFNLLEARGNLVFWEYVLSFVTKDGRLVQGSPMSPYLTNLAMIPFDVIVSRKLRKLDCVYTRYCDDIIISSEKKIDSQAVLEIIQEAIRMNELPLRIKPEKTRVGSIKGRNWNLGLMVNGKNEITVGHEQKKIMKAMLHHAIMNCKAGLQIENKSKLFGLLNYYRTVEPGYFAYILGWFANKYDVNIYDELKKK